ncbi:MAG: LysR family transcriptional regulator [Phormidesmis sp.]
MAGKSAKNLSDKVKLSQLKALISVAATGSFSEAALQLDVSQSTISHSIAALEEALGVVLVHRGRQGASLTPVGDRIFHQAKQTLSLVEEMAREASRARGVDGGIVRIAAFRSMASEVLPEAIAHLHQKHPSVQVSIKEFETTRGLVDSLIEGKADFAIAELLKSDDFETFLIMEDPFIALLPPKGYQPSEPYQLSWADLRKYPIITSESDCCQSIFPFLQQAQPPIKVDYLINSDSTAVSMSRQGLGISILPKLAAQPIPAEVSVVQLPFSLSRPLGISWAKAALLTPAAYTFLDIFKDLYSAQQYGEEHEPSIQAL